jgi:hypothetical protein
VATNWMTWPGDAESHGGAAESVRPNFRSVGVEELVLGDARLLEDGASERLLERPSLMNRDRQRAMPVLDEHVVATGRPIERPPEADERPDHAKGDDVREPAQVVSAGRPRSACLRRCHVGIQP